VITPDGVVKVLDFGLAKAHDLAASDVPGPTVSTMIDATGRGAVLGTAAYMSPEQARGKTVDRRTDLWAFGCVLYEMLTGRRAFGGDTTSDTIAAILDREPDWSALPPATPASLRRLLYRCLEKDPKRRLRDAADARLELDEPVEAHADREPAVVKGPFAPLHIALGMMTLLAIGGAVAALAGIFRPASGIDDVTRFSEAV